MGKNGRGGQNTLHNGGSREGGSTQGLVFSSDRGALHDSFSEGGEGSFFGRQRGGLKASLYPVSMYALKERFVIKDELFVCPYELFSGLEGHEIVLGLFHVLCQG